MSNVLRPAIIEAKLIPPPPTSAWLARPHLLAQLELIRVNKLTLLLAPAGSGKTTLLAQWVHDVERRNLPDQAVTVAWLTLDAADNEPARFFYYLLAAIKRARPDFQGYFFSHLDNDDAVSNAMVEGLLDQLAALPGDIIVVLDDAQHIDASPIVNALKRVLQLLPRNCHLVWCSRTLPPFGLSALKLEQSLRQLTHEQLRFSREDIVALNASLIGRNISADESAHLYELTEGWIAGVKLALLSCSSEHANDLSLNDFNGAHQDVMDYLGDVVLARLDASTQSFLLQTSILPRINADLCDHVLNRSDSLFQLDWLTSNQLFIQPLDTAQHWWRYHALFREFLENRLRVKSPELIPALHERACSYFLKLQDCDAALAHAKASGNDHLWLQVLAQVWNDWIKQGEFNRILHWSEQLDDNTIEAHPHVLCPMIAALIFARRFNQAAYYLDRLGAHADACDNDREIGTDDNDIAGEARFLGDMLELFQNDNAFRGHREMSVRNARLGTDLYSFTLAMRAYYLLLNHDFAAAMREADYARTYLQTAGQSYLASYATLIQILIDRTEGRMIEALVRTEEAFRALGNVRNPEWVNITTALTVVRYEQNQLDDAAQLCRELLPHLSGTCATEAITAVYVTLARIQCTRGNTREACALLNHVSRILALGHYDRFTSQIIFEKARLAYVAGDLRELDITARAASLHERFRSGEWRKPRPYDECWQRHGQALVYCLFAKRALPDAQAVLENLSVSAERAGCIARFAILQAMLAICFDLQQQSQRAMQCLHVAIERGGWVCFNRSLFDEAVGIAQLIKTRFVQQRASPTTMNHNHGAEIPDALLELFCDVLVEPTTATHTQLWTEPLTAKEEEIVELLVAGLSNKSISERAGIAITTTKWHLKNIYGKLRVQNRTQALQKLESA